MSEKPWAEPGLPIEERAERVWHGKMHSSNPDEHVAIIAEALRAARADALEEAAVLFDAARQPIAAHAVRWLKDEAATGRPLVSGALSS